MGPLCGLRLGQNAFLTFKQQQQQQPTGSFIIELVQSLIEKGFCYDHFSEPEACLLATFFYKQPTSLLMMKNNEIPVLY